jgi:hypothetical protein
MLSCCTWLALGIVLAATAVTALPPPVPLVGTLVKASADVVLWQKKSG